MRTILPCSPVVDVILSLTFTDFWEANVCFDKEKNAAGRTEVFFKHTYLLVEQTPGDGGG